MSTAAAAAAAATRPAVKGRRKAKSSGGSVAAALASLPLAPPSPPTDEEVLLLAYWRRVCDSVLKPVLPVALLEGLLFVRRQQILALATPQLPAFLFRRLKWSAAVSTTLTLASLLPIACAELGHEVVTETNLAIAVIRCGFGGPAVNWVHAKRCKDLHLHAELRNDDVEMSLAPRHLITASKEMNELRVRLVALAGHVLALGRAVLHRPQWGLASADDVSADHDGSGDDSDGDCDGDKSTDEQLRPYAPVVRGMDVLMPVMRELYMHARAFWHKRYSDTVMPPAPGVSLLGASTGSAGSEAARPVAGPAGPAGPARACVVAPEEGDDEPTARRAVEKSLDPGEKWPIATAEDLALAWPHLPQRRAADRIADSQAALMPLTCTALEWLQAYFETSPGAAAWQSICGTTVGDNTCLETPPYCTRWADGTPPQYADYCWMPVMASYAAFLDRDVAVRSSAVADEGFLARMVLQCTMDADAGQVWVASPLGYATARVPL